MAQPRCYIFQPEPLEKAWYLEHPIDGLETLIIEEPLTLGTVAQYADADIIVFLSYAPFGQAFLDALPQLKMIATRSTGYNQFDLNALRQRKVALYNLVDYSTVAVAEHTLGLLLGLAKRYSGQWAEMASGQFRRDPRWTGLELVDRTLGIWGTGAIGQAVITRAKAFGLKILATSRTENPALAEQLGFTYVPFEQLLSDSDFLSLHVALTPETANRLDQQAFTGMKPTACLINTARGGLVDSASLLAALQTGEIAGAALDTLPTESILLSPEQLTAVTSGDNPDTALKRAVEVDQALMRHPKVIACPHTAFYTEEAVVRMAQQTFGNIQAFLRQDSTRRLV